MKPDTHARVKEAIVAFAKNNLGKVGVSIDEVKRAFPFHALFFPDEALLSFKIQRSLVTRMGMKLYPQIAEIISKDKYSDAHRNHLISGRVEEAKVNAIDRMIDELRTRKRKPKHDQELSEIARAKGGRKIDLTTIADLYVGDFQPDPVFLEIKSPRPNLDICAESKKKMLYFHAINAGKNVEAYLAFPYNPFIYREKYDHSFTMQVMDLENEVLLGEEMWDKLGGKDTYDELLKIIEEARSQISQKPKQTDLGYGF